MANKWIKVLKMQMGQRNVEASKHEKIIHGGMVDS